MHWLYLLIASIFEIGWPIGLKLAHLSQHRIFWIVFSIIIMALSGYFLYLAQKYIPIGIAYAIWTGLGILGVFFISVILFNDNFTFVKFIGVIFILSGILILKLQSS